MLESFNGVWTALSDEMQFSLGSEEDQPASSREVVKQGGDRRRVQRWTRLARILGVLVLAAYFVGFKPVFDVSEVRCPAGYIKQGIGLQDYSYWCIPPGGAAELDRRTLPMGSQRRQIGLYFANLDVRVFDFDGVSGNYLWFARNVPAPP